MRRLPFGKSMATRTTPVASKNAPATRNPRHTTTGAIGTRQTLSLQVQGVFTLKGLWPLPTDALPGTSERFSLSTSSHSPKAVFTPSPIPRLAHHLMQQRKRQRSNVHP